LILKKLPLVGKLKFNQVLERKEGVGKKRRWEEGGVKRRRKRR